MKKLFVFVLFVSLVNLNFASNIDSINGDSNVVLQEERATSEIEINPKGTISQVDKEQISSQRNPLKNKRKKYLLYLVNGGFGLVFSL